MRPSLVHTLAMQDLKIWCVVNSSVGCNVQIGANRFSLKPSQSGKHPYKSCFWSQTHSQTLLVSSQPAENTTHLVGAAGGSDSKVVCAGAIATLEQPLESCVMPALEMLLACRQMQSRQYESC